MGENRLQKSSDLFHLGRTWFKLEAEISSILIGFLTPEKVLIPPPPHPIPLPCYLRFGCGVTSL